jgi:hypothetical protein
LLPALPSREDGPIIARVADTNGCKIDGTYSGSAEMQCVDGDQLRIETGSKSTIRLCLHDALGVHITYRALKRLMTSTKELERQAEALYQAGNLVSAMGRPFHSMRLRERHC